MVWRAWSVPGMATQRLHVGVHAAVVPTPLLDPSPAGVGCCLGSAATAGAARGVI